MLRADSVMLVAREEAVRWTGIGEQVEPYIARRLDVSAPLPLVQIEGMRTCSALAAHG